MNQGLSLLKEDAGGAAIACGARFFLLFVPRVGAVKGIAQKTAKKLSRERSIASLKRNILIHLDSKNIAETTRGGTG